MMVMNYVPNETDTHTPSNFQPRRNNWNSRTKITEQVLVSKLMIKLCEYCVVPILTCRQPEMNFNNTSGQYYVLDQKKRFTTVIRFNFTNQLHERRYVPLII